MKTIQLVLLLCIVVFAAGCPKYKPSVNFKNKSSFVGKVNEHIEAKQVEYLRVLGSDPAKARTIRNELIEDALPYIDDGYTDFITDIEAGRDRTNFIADVVELGASSAVGIIKGSQRSIQIVGIALTAFRGGRRSADLNFYKEQTTPILINKMDGNRAKVRATILTREKEGVDTYPIGAAISDIVAYYNAGTLVRAFTELQKDTAVQTKQSEDNLQLLKGVSLTPEATPEFRNLSVSAQKILLSLLNDLNDADAKKKASATERVKKIVAALEKDPAAVTVLKAAGVSSQETDGLKLRAGLLGVRTNAAETNNTDLMNKINQAIVDN